jgi:hypothetical protein
MAGKTRNRELCEKASQGTQEREKLMQGDVKRALAWGFGLGIGFAVAGMALGLFKRVR